MKIKVRVNGVTYILKRKYQRILEEKIKDFLVGTFEIILFLGYVYFMLAVSA